MRGVQHATRRLANMHVVQRPRRLYTSTLPLRTRSNPMRLVANMSTEPASPLQTGKIAVNGIELFYAQQGAGGPPVLCIPGCLGTVDSDFGPTLTGLAAGGFTAVSFDPRGYGQSRPPLRDFPLDYYARDAADGALFAITRGVSVI